MKAHNRKLTRLTRPTRIQEHREVTLGTGNTTGNITETLQRLTKQSVRTKENGLVITEGANAEMGIR